MKKLLTIVSVCIFLFTVAAGVQSIINNRSAWKKMYSPLDQYVKTTIAAQKATDSTRIANQQFINQH